MTEPAAPSPAPSGRSLSRLAFAGATWLAVLNGIGGVGMLALTWWLNRALPDAPLQMGQWSLALSLLLMTSLIFEGGIPATVQQRRDLDPNALGALAWFQAGLGVAGAGALALLAGPLASLLSDGSGRDHMAFLIRLAAPAVLVIAAGLPPKALLQRDLRFRAVGAVESGSTAFCIVLCIALGPRFGATGLVLALVFRHLAETVAYWVLSGWNPLRLLRGHDWAAARDPLRFGAGMAGQSLLGTLVRQGDVVLVGALLGTVAAGVYRQVQAIVVQPNAKLTMYVARAAFAAFSKAQDDPERLLRGLRKLQRLLALAVLPMLFGLAAISPRLLAEYLGAQYAAHLETAVTAMHWLCLAAAIQSAVQILTVVLNAAGHARPVLSRQLAAAAAMVVTMIAGTPWGLPGVAVGRGVAAVVQALAFTPLASRALGFGPRDLLRAVREALPAALACFAVAAATGWWMSSAWPASAPGAGAAWPLRAALAIQVAAGAAAYGGVLLAAGLRPRAEWKALRG